ncbi:MAG: CBS domain-containing protein [Alphaproteobacteria bacterium]
MRQLSDIVFRQTPLMLVQDENVQNACREMHAKRVRSVLVVDDTGGLVGIFTGRDAVCRVVACSKSAAQTGYATTC